MREKEVQQKERRSFVFHTEIVDSCLDLFGFSLGCLSTSVSKKNKKVRRNST
jgi:hypothetical protein